MSCQGHKKKMSEEKKDHEYHMARSQLKTVKNAANRLEKKMGKKGEGQLKAWVQSKITKAADYIDTAADYVTNEETVNEEGLRDWFGKSKSKDGKKGWVNVVTGGTCASDEPGEGTPKCVSSAKRASMTKAERLSAQRRKKKADPGQQQKTGAAKPTYVSTDPKKKMKEGVEVTEAKDKKGKGSGTKDACYHKVKSRYSVWPSAYASGALVKCRKVGAANWGNKSEEFMALPEMTDIQINAMRQAGIEVEVIDEKCWKGYEKKGMKTMFGKRYPNCVKKEEVEQVKEGCDCECGKDPCECKKQKKYYGGSPAKPGPDKNYVKPMGEETIELTDAYGETFATVVDVVKAEPIKTVESNVEYETYDIESMTEAVRVPSKTGHIVMVNLGWRGKYYSIKMFFPQMGKPSRKDVQDQIDKVYPGGKLYTFIATNYEPGQPLLHAEGAAWTKKEGKSKSGGLNEKGRKSYERENPGSDLKAPSKKVGNPRRASFCARMKGMKKKLTSKKTANDPDSRINKSLRAWNC